MSGLVTRFSYDQTGTNPDNLITNEPHALSSKQVRAFAPIYGPFFTDNAVIYDAATNAILERGTQYQCVELLRDLSLKLGKEICCVVLILDTNVSSNIKFTYNCVGGVYQNQSAEAIVSLYETVAADTRPVDWTNVLNKPLQFEPTDHIHLLSDVNGFEPVVTVLERIRNALMLSDVPIYEAMIDYFNRLVAELQVAVENGKTTIAALMQQLTALEAALNAEIATRSASDTATNSSIASLLSQLQAEINNRTQADTTISNNLAQEISDRKAADSAEVTARTNAINTESTARVNGDISLGSRIDNEAAVRAAADTALQTNLNTEITNRTNAVTAEASARATAVTNESTARIAGDANLQTQIDNLGNTLSSSYLKLDGSNNMTGVTRSTKTWDGSEGGFSMPQLSYLKFSTTKATNSNNDTIFGNGSAGNFNWYRYNGTSWVSLAVLDASGNFTASGDLAAYSDSRLKTEWKRISNALDKIDAIEGGTFRRKATGEAAVGVIAQAVRAVLPEAVKIDSDGYLSVTYGNMVGLLIEGIKELREIVIQQQIEIEALKNKTTAY